MKVYKLVTTNRHRQILTSLFPLLSSKYADKKKNSGYIAASQNLGDKKADTACPLNKYDKYINKYACCKKTLFL